MNSPTPIGRIRQFAPLALVLISAAAAVAAYMQALDYPFISDETVYITENHKLAALPLGELWRLFTEPYNSAKEFLPLRDLSYWIDIALFGLTPSAFRVHSILIYLLCLPLVYATTSGVWRYFRPADAASVPWAAAAVTALFALHPALVESVVWISGRKYILPDMFSMLALWLAVKARRERCLSAPHAAATLVAFVAVMLSKSSYVAVAPIIVLLWSLFWLDIPVPDRRRSMLLWSLVLLFLGGLLTKIFIFYNNGYDSIPFYFGMEAVARTLAILGWLARLAVSPESRHYLYPVFEDPYLPAMVALGAAVLAASTAGTVMLLRKRSLEGFALAVFFLLCVPYMQLLPHAPPSLASDRYLALAVWPATLLLVALSWRLKPIPRTVLLLAIALSWGFQTAGRPRDWSSFETLVDSDIHAYPGYYMPAFQKVAGVQLPLGLTREAMETASSIATPDLRDITVKLVEADYAVGDAVATANPQKAMTLLWKMGADLKQLPAQSKWNSPIHNFWVQTVFVLTKEWKYLAKRFPDDVPVRYNAGLWMLNHGDFENAAVHLRAATESQRLPEPERGVAFMNLGIALLNSGHAAQAETPLRAALEQAPPDMRAYCVLSETYKQTNRLEEAKRAEPICRSLKPGGKATP